MRLSLLLLILVTSCSNDSNQQPVMVEKYNAFQQDSISVHKLIRHTIAHQTENSISDTLTFLSGLLFTSTISHKFIQCTSYSGTYIEIFTEKDNYTSPIFQEKADRLNYTKDSIFDINGDSIPDIAILWYPSSGCCLANMYDCYLYDISTDAFSKKVEIINPMFTPRQARILSMTYDHPGYASYYEYQWNGAQLDTLKHFEWNDLNHEFIIETTMTTGSKSFLHEVPEVLKSHYAYDWFSEAVERREN